MKPVNKHLIVKELNTQEEKTSGGLYIANKVNYNCVCYNVISIDDDCNPKIKSMFDLVKSNGNDLVVLANKNNVVKALDFDTHEPISLLEDKNVLAMTEGVVNTMANC